MFGEHTLGSIKATLYNIISVRWMHADHCSKQVRGVATVDGLHVGHIAPYTAYS